MDHLSDGINLFKGHFYWIAINSSKIKLNNIIFYFTDRWYWYQQAKSQLLKNLDDDRNYNVAKNLILFIGDGMGMTTVTTARILRGQKKGHTGEENELAFDKFEYVALSKVLLN